MDPKDFAPYSKTVDKAYDDAVSPAAKKAGELAADGMDAAHRLLKPVFDLVRNGGDRLQILVNRIAVNVPPERQQPAPTNIAGPILWNLYFTEDGSELQAMYLRLLQAAIDRDNVEKAHPAFVRTIESLSPIDALFLKHIHEHPIIDKEYAVDKVQTPLFVVLYDINTMLNLPNFITSLTVSFEHLRSLGLLRTNIAEPSYNTFMFSTDIFPALLTVSDWGAAFCDVCLPLDYPTTVSED